MNPDTLPVSESSQEVSPYWITHPQESTLPLGYPFAPSLQVSPLQNWEASHTDLSLEDIPWSAPPRTVSFDNISSINSHHQYGPHNDNSSSHPTEHHMIKQGGASSLSICPSENTNTIIMPNIASIDERSRQIPIANSHSVSIPNWQKSHHHQRHSSSRSLDHYGAWNEPHGDSILMKGESDHDNLSSYSYGELGNGIFYPPH